MTEVGIYEAKTRFAELVKLVGSGESVVITNRGQPVAELVAPRQRKDVELTDLIASIKENRVGQIDGKLFSELRLEGRRS